MLLEQMYSKVQPVDILKEQYGDKKFVAEISSNDVNVYNVDSDSYSLGVSNNLTLVYEIDIDFRKWGIKDFVIIPRKLLPFSIDIEDDYEQEDFASPKTLVDFSQGLDVSNFKLGNVELKTGSSLFPTSIDLWIKKVNDNWEVVSEQCEINF